MSGLANLELDDLEFVEVDPTGRYGRYNEILGKGASKTVYRAFDEYEGIEVAWNQVKLFDFLQSPEDLERLYCEIHLLKTLKHQNIMKFYTSWVDTSKRNINFVTEMFTSGTLRQYRQKHRRVNIRAVKHWCRQILKGLLYLHSHDPPVIHRDLKCDNIFVNGNQGEVKIGDLGLAAIMRKSSAAHCVGTPEFMAPEVYEEKYNELVDIYSFGMCILEMITFEYPYSECTHPAQIYKKVISGKKPDALYQVKDPEVRQFIEKCLANVSLRLSARELLDDPFLQTEVSETNLRPIKCRSNLDNVDPDLGKHLPDLDYRGISFSNSSFHEYSNGVPSDDHNEWSYQPTDTEQNGIDLFEHNDDEHEEEQAHLDITIKGKRRKDGSIFIRLRISDKEDRIRNIYFPFDIESDTALSVATEMIGELDITDQDVTIIADMIDGEIATLVPEWRPGPTFEETPRFANTSICQNCVSNHTSTGSFLNFLSNNLGVKDMQNITCCFHGCAATHGRFEEYTYDLDSSLQNGFHDAKEPVLRGQSNGFRNEEYRDHHESVECSDIGSIDSHSAEEHENIDDKEDKILSSVEDFIESISVSHSVADLSDNCENETQKELRWLKAKYQLELRDLREHQLEQVQMSAEQHSNPVSTSKHGAKYGMSPHASASEENCKGTSKNSDSEKMSNLLADAHVQESCLNSMVQRVRESKAVKGFQSDDRITSIGFHTQTLLPNILHRTTSLPIDAVDI